MRMALALPLLLAASCAATQRAPVAVLYEDEPWSLGTVASSSPVFALYDDGLVIYLERPGSPVPRYACVTVDAAERARLRAALPAGLDAHYDLFDMPHHPFNVLHVWRDGERETVTVYGDLGEHSELRGKCPPSFLAAYDALRRFQSEQAVAWRPEKLQLHFSEQELTRPPRRPWPAGWPDLSHPDTERTSDGYVLYLDYEHRDELAALWEHPLNSHADVEISGRRGMVAYSVPFPCHEAWDTD